MAIEIERKFLIINDGWRQQVSKSKRIVQGYLNKSAERSVRIRISGEDANINIKSKRGEGGITRLEYEYAIPLSDAQELLDNVALKPVIDKTRHYIFFDALCWEIDEFYGDNAGLIVAELELPNVDTAFPKPDWLGQEVSDDPRYYNMNLMQLPYTQWPENQRD